MAQEYISQVFTSKQSEIEAYFNLGLSYESIIACLMEYRDIQISLRTLRRRLRQFGLKRHNVLNCSEEAFYQAVENQLRSSAGGAVGYRQIWHNLRLRHHLTVSRSKVYVRGSQLIVSFYLVIMLLCFFCLCSITCV